MRRRAQRRLGLQEAGARLLGGGDPGVQTCQESPTAGQRSQDPTQVTRQHRNPDHLTGEQTCPPPVGFSFGYLFVNRKTGLASNSGCFPLLYEFFAIRLSTVNVLPQVVTVQIKRVFENVLHTPIYDERWETKTKNEGFIEFDIV